MDLERPPGDIGGDAAANSLTPGGDPVSKPTTVSSGKSAWDLLPSGVILVLVPTLLSTEDGTTNPVTVGDGDGANATPSPLLRRPPAPALPPNDEPGVIMLLPLPVSDGDDDSTLNPATLALGDAERTSATECAVGLTDCLAVGTPRLELTAPWMSASCAGDVPNIIYVSEPVPVSWVRWRRAAAVCAAGEVNMFASEPRLVYFGGSENIPRPLAGGSDAGGGDATTRAPVRAKESNPTYSREHDPGETPAGGRSRRRPGAFVASSPVAEELGQLERKPKNRGNTPNEVPAQKVAGAEDPRTRQDPPHGPSKTRAEPVDKVQRPGREIPDRALRRRANTDVASRARLPGFSPRVDRKMRRGVGRRTGVREKRELTFAM